MLLHHCAYNEEVSLTMKWQQHFLWAGSIILGVIQSFSSDLLLWPLSHNQTHPDCSKLTSPVTFWQCLKTHFHVPCTMKLSQASSTWVVDLFLIFHLHRKHSGEVDPRGQALLSQRSHHLSRKQERPAQRWAHTSGAGQNEAGTRNHLLLNAQLRPEVVDLPPPWLSQ